MIQRPMGIYIGERGWGGIVLRADGFGLFFGMGSFIGDFEVVPRLLGTFVMGRFTGVNGVDIGAKDYALWKGRVFIFCKRFGLEPMVTVVMGKDLKVLVLIVFARGGRDSPDLRWVSRFREICPKDVGVQVEVEAIRGGGFRCDLAGMHFGWKVTQFFGDLVDVGRLFPRMRADGVSGVIWGYQCKWF